MNIKINLFILFMIFIFARCKISKIPKQNSPYKIEIYVISNYKHYIVSVPCDDVKELYDYKKEVTSKRDVKKIYAIFSDSTNLKLDTAFKTIDSKMSIQFIHNNRVVENICWSGINDIEKDGKIYTYNEKINNYISAWCRR